MASAQTAANVEGAASGIFKGISAVCSAACRTGQQCCNAFGGCIKKLPATYISILLRVLNIGNAALLGLACFEAYNIVTSLAAGGSAPITRAFLATYIGIFAAMLAAFEMRVRYTAGFIRKNCGFLFTYTGRACFLIFLGAVCFGMLDDDAKAAAETAYTVCLVVGLVTVGNAALNCFIICNHPEFQAMNAPDKAHGGSDAGTDPSKMSEEQVRAYLAAHPEIAAQVAGVNKTSSSGYDDSDHVTVPIDEPGSNGTVSEWGTPQGNMGNSTNNTKKSSGGGFFSSFGGGNTKKTTASSTTAAVPKAEVYQPPSVPSHTSVAYDSSPITAQQQHHHSVSNNNQPTVNNSNFAISGDDDDNPFAQSDNPFGGR